MTFPCACDDGRQPMLGHVFEPGLTQILYVFLLLCCYQGHGGHCKAIVCVKTMTKYTMKGRNCYHVM